MHIMTKQFSEGKRYTSTEDHAEGSYAFELLHFLFVYDIYEHLTVYIQ